MIAEEETKDERKESKRREETPDLRARLIVKRKMGKKKKA